MASARLVTIRSQSPKARVLLRSPVITDAPSLTARGNDPQCILYLPHLQRTPENKITVESNEKQIKAWRAESGIDGFFLVVVLLPEHGGKTGVDTSNEATIGDTGLGPLNFSTKTGECGIMLNSGSSVRGKGFAVEVLDMNFAFAFDHLGLEKINFGTHRDNVPMRSLLEKKFGLPAQWREKQGDWTFEATKDWWVRRMEAAGDERVLVDVEETPVEAK